MRRSNSLSPDILRFRRRSYLFWGAIPKKNTRSNNQAELSSFRLGGGVLLFPEKRVAPK